MPASDPVDWLVDTGADTCSVHNSVGAPFDTTLCPGLSASSTSGGGGFQVVLGLTAVFDVEDAAGNVQTVRSARYVAVKSGNTGSNLLGMGQVADVGAEVRWDPAKCTGKLLLKPAPVAGATPGQSTIAATGGMPDDAWAILHSLRASLRKHLQRPVTRQYRPRLVNAPLLDKLATTLDALGEISPSTPAEDLTRCWTEVMALLATSVGLPADACVWDDVLAAMRNATGESGEPVGWVLDAYLERTASLADRLSRAMDRTYRASQHKYPLALPPGSTLGDVVV